MSWRFEHYNRIESATPDSNIDRGFRAEVADPLYFLGRQWQLGEHQGEDAASPMEVVYSAEHFDIDPLEKRPLLDPTVTPPEVLVETEVNEWWTPGRRIELGKAYQIAEEIDLVDLAFNKYLLQDMVPPYNYFNTRAFDGMALWKDKPENTVFSDVPKLDDVNHWDTAELIYNATFKANGTDLELQRHSGGHLDWYSVDADGPIEALTVEPKEVRILPTRMNYPGAPNPRWWQIENHRVDIGGMAPDRGHFATMLLLDLVMGHSDDWYTFPVVTESGNVLRMNKVIVRDSFGEQWSVEPPKDWSMFQVRGLKETSLLIWPTVTSPLSGSIQEQVDFGIDEDANVMWAIEKIINGKEVATVIPRKETSAFDKPIDGSARNKYRYNATQGLRHNWHPYTIQEVDNRRVFVQGRAADLSSKQPQLFPEPQAKVLFDYENYADKPEDQLKPVHQIEPSTVNPSGFSIQRKWKLVRNTNAEPMLWIERLRKPLQVPPTSSLKVDTFETILDTTES